MLYYKLYRLLTVYMGSYTRHELIWPRGVNRGVICAQAVYMNQHTLSRNCITIL